MRADVVVLSGDRHMAWVSALHHGERRLALELSASTLTGSAMGQLLGTEGSALGRRFARDNPDVALCNPLVVGFVAVTVACPTIEAGFVSVTHPRGTSDRTVVARRATPRKIPSGAIWSNR